MYRIERRYGFLYAEYKPSCWWWEVMKILLRQIIIIVTKVPVFELLEKALIIVLLLQCYLLYAFQKKPYKNNKLNQVDLQLNAISIFMILLALYFNGTANDSKQIIIVLFIVLLKILSLCKIINLIILFFIFYHIFIFICKVKSQ